MNQHLTNIRKWTTGGSGLWVVPASGSIVASFFSYENIPQLKNIFTTISHSLTASDCIAMMGVALAALALTSGARFIQEERLNTLQKAFEHEVKEAKQALNELDNVRVRVWAARNAIVRISKIFEEEHKERVSRLFLSSMMLFAVAALVQALGSLGLVMDFFELVASLKLEHVNPNGEVSKGIMEGATMAAGFACLIAGARGLLATTNGKYMTEAMEKEVDVLESSSGLKS